MLAPRTSKVSVLSGARRLDRDRIGPPAEPHEVGEDHRHRERGDHPAVAGRRAIEHRRDGDLLLEQRQRRHRQHRQRRADEPRQAEQGDEGGAEHRAQHDQIALREVEDVGRAIEHVEAHRHQRVEAAGGERADQQIGIHCAAAYLAISRKMPIARGSLPDATEASAMSSMPIAVWFSGVKLMVPSRPL